MSWYSFIDSEWRMKSVPSTSTYWKAESVGPAPEDSDDASTFLAAALTADLMSWEFLRLLDVGPPPLTTWFLKLRSFADESVLLLYSFASF